MTFSTVLLVDALGRETEIAIPHSELAAPDAVVDMAREHAGMPPAQMRRGRVIARSL